MSGPRYEVLDAESQGLRVQLEVLSRPNYALALAGVAPIRAVRAWAPPDRSLMGLEIVVSVLPSLGATISTSLRAEGEIPPGGLVRFDDAEPLQALIEPLARASEATHAVLDVRAGVPSAVPGSFAVGQPVAQVRAGIDIDAFNEFRADRALYATLAAFVQPNSAALTPILRAASELLGSKTGSTSLEGYQSGPARAHQIAGALYESMRAADIAYVNPPASFETTGQKVRTTEQVLSGHLGTCIDLAVMYAAALEASGLYPVVFLTATHAFAGFYRDEMYGEKATITDPNVLANLVEAGIVVPVELTGIGTHGRSAAFRAASDAAGAFFRASIGQLRGMVDIVKCRLDGVRPMPSAIGAAGGADDIADERPFVARSSLAAISSPKPAPLTRTLRQRPDLSPPRIQAWKRELLDLSLRNPLLNLPRNRRVVDLIVPSTMLPRLDEELHAGHPIRLQPADELGALDQARGLRTAAELGADAFELMFKVSRSVFTSAPGTWVTSALRSLRRSARLLEQETGSNYLFLAIGTLIHVKPNGDEARAPIFLLPVRLSGGIAGRPYQIRADDEEEASANLCLAQWLALTRGLALPELTGNGGDALTLPEALASMRRRLLEAQLPLRIEESASLALLKFSTFQIWRDLDTNWEHFMANPVVAHLVERPGETFADPADDGPVPVDEGAMRLPIAADGSQLRAIARGSAGRSFVLEGPPGTGKSQTIANLIAHSLAVGKKVLFVAEKQAALDVVSRRLRDVGIAPFCLDLHGEHQSMSQIRSQLREALDASAPLSPLAWQTVDARRAAALTHLTSYPPRVHARNAAGHSLWSAYDALWALGPGPVGAISPANVSGLGEDGAMSTAVRQASQAVARLQDTAIQLGLRSRHPWLIAAGGAAVEPGSDIAQAAGALRAARHQVCILGPRARALLALLPPAAALAGALELLSARGTELQPQPGDAAYVTRPQWRDAVAALASEVQALGAAHPVLALLTPGALGAPRLDEWITRSEAADASWWLRGRRRRKLIEEIEAAGHLADAGSVGGRGLEGDAVAPEPETLTAFFHAWREAREASDAVSARARAIAGLRLPDSWRPEMADAEPGLAQSAQLAQLGASAEARGLLGPLFALSPEEEAVWRQVAHAWQRWLGAVGGTDRSVAWWLGNVGAARGQGAEAPDWLAAWAHDEPYWAQGIEASGSLHAQRFAALAPEVAVLDAAGLGAFADQALSGAISPPDVTLAFARGLAQASMAERSLTGDLASFDTAAQDREVASFLSSAALTRAQAVERIPAAVLARRPFDPDHLRGEVAELRRQIDRKRGGKSFRELVRDYPDALSALTPCFLMSPGSVSHFLDASSLTFDIAIFDEASQIRVPQAIGAMGRARSVIVVGDSKQMPPTRVMEVDTSRFDDEDQRGAESVVVEDLESILSEAVESGLPQEWLAWHYRSRDESLIAFSNERYYSSRLVTLPTPWLDPPSAVSWRRVEGTFDRGASRTNLVEAGAIVDEIAHRLADPATAKESIGVVTFNIQQRDLILTLLEDSPDLHIQSALAAEAGEELFVKNLENVQGDERDTILFSLAFSPDPETGVLPLNFGPLNLEGGERRLNVAVTRARSAVVLFSSFDPAHIDLTRTNSQGLKDLRAYLEYAEKGATDRHHGQLVRDRLGDEVAAALIERGLEVARGVGLSTFNVDVAARRPGTDEWELAIMLDSPAWNSRPTVADREGAPTLLHDLAGWPRVRRLWLPGWLRAREDCVEGLVAALAEPPDAAVPDAAALHAPTSESLPAPSFAPPGQPPMPPIPLAPAPAASTSGTFTPAPLEARFAQRVLNTQGALAEYAITIARDALAIEGPMPIERLTSVIGRRCGYSRLGQAKRAAIESALTAHFPATALGGTVIWPEGQDPQTWRGVRRTTTGDRTFDEVPFHELVNAMEKVATEAMSLTRPDLDREALNVLGFTRVTDTTKPRLDAALTHALATGRLAEREGRYYPD